MQLQTKAEVDEYIYMKHLLLYKKNNNVNTKFIFQFINMMHFDSVFVKNV